MGTAIQKAQHSRKDAILVLGMHRSGTSLLGGILECLGCEGPRTQLEASERNPKGYFESRRVLELNDEILAAVGTRWNDWQPMREGWLESSRFNEFRSRAAEVVHAEYGNASMIYLKDPRICRILPLWQDAFEMMGYRVACVHTHRHPVDVATSLKLRKNIEVEPVLGMLSWLRHVLDAEAASRDLPRIFTSYSHILRDWKSLADRAEATLDVLWPVMTRTASERIAQLAEPGLRHHASDVDSFLSNPLVPEPFRETLRILEDWAQNGENLKDRATLVRLRREFDVSAPLLHEPIQALEAMRRDLGNLTLNQGMADARTAELEVLTAKLAEAEAREAELVTEIETWTDRLIDRDKKISRLQKEADLSRHEQAAKESELGKAREQAKVRTAELGALSTHLQDIHNIYKSSTSWKVSAPVRLIGKLVRSHGLSTAVRKSATSAE